MFRVAQPGPCAVCGHEKATPCPRCRVDAYCGKAHQQQDWPRHKAACGAVESRVSPGLGSHLVATRDIPAGTIILKESPIVIFPNALLRPGQTMCVGCCGLLPSSGQAPWRQWAQCKGCGWPLCTAACGKSVHHQPECAAFQRAHFKMPHRDLQRIDVRWVSALAALRVYLVAQDHPELMELRNELKCEALEGPEGLAYAAKLKYFVQFTNKTFKDGVRWLRSEAKISWIPEGDLLKAAAIAGLNNMQLGAHLDIFTRSNQRECLGHGGEGVYLGIAKLSHSCRPNTGVLPMDLRRQEKAVMTSRAVVRGEVLTQDYQDDPFKDTAERRLAVMGWGLVCRCERCADPTELGLYVGSPCCGRCAAKSLLRGGKACRRYLTSKDCKVWRCGGCGLEASAEEVAALTSRPEVELRELMSTDDAPVGHPAPWQPWEDFLRRHLWPRGPLHPTHSLALRCKWRLMKTVHMHGLSWAARMSSRGAEMLASWEQEIRDVLAALEVLRPGCNNKRMLALMSFIPLLMAKGGLSFSSSPAACKASMKEAQNLVEDLRRMMVGEEDVKIFNESYDKPYKGMFDMLPYLP